ncbi:MAG: hypothetical protein AB7O52_02190 [Planctomycetota bacterium]
MTRTCLVVLLTTLWSGCSSAPPTRSEFSDFYRGWPELTPELAHDLEAARVSAQRDPGARESLLQLARASAKLAAHQAEIWLSGEAAPNVPPQDGRRTEALLRSRILEASEQALGYYYQLRFLGGALDWTDEASLAWLLVLLGRDDEAGARLEQALASPDLTDEGRSWLTELQTGVGTLPAAR